jgi:hypothetical protein
MGVHVIKIHERKFLATTFNITDTAPVFFIFSSENAEAVLENLQNEVARESYVLNGPVSRRLLGAASKRAQSITTLLRGSQRLFKQIRAEVAIGNTGNEAAQQLVDFMEKYRQQIEPSID